MCGGLGARIRARMVCLAALAGVLGALSAARPAAAAPAGPAPGSPAYITRDAQNMAESSGRNQTYESTPAYVSAFLQESPGVSAADVQNLLASSTPPVTLATVIPPGEGGNPYRELSWAGGGGAYPARGRLQQVTFLNRYGARIVGRVFAPIEGHRDPDTGRLLHAPYPGAVFIPGSIQAPRSAYDWAAEDLAERGWVVLVFDAQGQGLSESFPSNFPACLNGGTTFPGEQTSCPGVPYQQQTNFEYGGEDAADFFWSTPSAPYAGSRSLGATAPGTRSTDSFNPYWQLFDRTPDPSPVTRGRPYRFAFVGQSLGAAAATVDAELDPRASALVAFDKLNDAPSSTGRAYAPVVPALGVQSEYFLNPVPYYDNAGNGPGAPSSAPDPTVAPDPYREVKTGYEHWARARVDSMMLTLRRSTHIEYVDIPFILTASRYGQAISSAYMVNWLERYITHDAAADARLKATAFQVLEPQGVGTWGLTPTLTRDDNLSFYFCSAWRYHDMSGGLVERVDPVGDGCNAATIDGAATAASGASTPSGGAGSAGLANTAAPAVPLGGSAAAVAVLLTAARSRRRRLLSG